MTDQDPEARMREKAREVAVRWVNRGLSDGDGDLLVQEFTQAFLEVVREATANNPFVAFYESGEQPGEFIQVDPIKDLHDQLAQARAEIDRLEKENAASRKR